MQTRLSPDSLFNVHVVKHRDMRSARIIYTLAVLVTRFPSAHLKIETGVIVVVLAMIFMLANPASAVIRVPTGVKCSDAIKTCVERGEKTIDGIKVKKDCWRYAYTKTCEFPSKNDCHKLSHCYEVGLKECLLHDSLGNCVNQRKEFSCKKRHSAWDEREITKHKLKGDEAKRILCKGIPCIDGNCVDKRYAMDSDMLTSASYLSAGSKMKSSKLFEGFGQTCTKKPVEYLNCCKKKGWGAVLGAKCNQGERDLQDMRAKNLCVYVGKSTSGMKPVHTNKHHFCCFGNMLNKVLQVEARKQLGLSFGSGRHPDCRGLTIDEIQKLNFEKMDFSEFTADIKKRMKLPSIGDLEGRMADSIPKIKQVVPGEERPELNPSNKNAGVNESLLKGIGEEKAYDE